MSFDIEKKLQGSSKRQSSLKRKLTIENEETESESDSLDDLDISSDGSDDDLLDDCDNDGINDGQDSSSEQLYGEELSHKKVKEGIWVVVEYEGEKFLGKVQSKSSEAISVLCLEKHLGIREPQSFEKGGAIDYKSVYETKLKPYQT